MFYRRQVEYIYAAAENQAINPFATGRIKNKMLIRLFAQTSFTPLQGCFLLKPLNTGHCPALMF